MIQRLYRWFIGHAIDSGRPIPGWLSRRIDRDPDLQEYCRHLELLIGRLRKDAGRLNEDVPALNACDFESLNHSSLQRPSRQRPSLLAEESSPRKLVWMSSAIAVAASIAILLLYLPSADEDRRIAQQNSPIRTSSIESQSEPGEIREQLLAATRTWKSRLAEELKSKGEFLERQKLFRSLPSTEQIVQSTESLGVASAKPLQMISEGMNQEKDRVENDIRNGFAYFAQTVPKRMISLVLNP